MKALLTACAAAMVSAVISLSPDGGVDAASSPPNASLESDTSRPSAVWVRSEKRVLQLHNNARANAGVSALTRTIALGKAAGKRCSEIITKFDHFRPDGRSWSTVLADFGISYSIAGENIAYGYSTPKSVHNAWMNSSGHRANILRSTFKYAGIGNCQNSSGTQYWVGIFTG